MAVGFFRSGIKPVQRLILPRLEIPRECDRAWNIVDSVILNANSVDVALAQSFVYFPNLTMMFCVLRPMTVHQSVASHLNYLSFELRIHCRPSFPLLTMSIC